VVGGSFRRALRVEALRRDELPRTAAPAPVAAGPRRHAPDAVPHEQGPGRHARAECADRRAKVTTTGPEHRAWPRSALQRQGHTEILSNRFTETIFGAHA
jgi:hypothetical protein